MQRFQTGNNFCFILSEYGVPAYDPLKTHLCTKVTLKINKTTSNNNHLCCNWRQGKRNLASHKCKLFEPVIKTFNMYSGLSNFSSLTVPPSQSNVLFLSEIMGFSPQPVKDLVNVVQ